MAMSLSDLSSLECLNNGHLAGLRKTFQNHGFDSSYIGRVERIAPRQFDQVRLPVVHWWLRHEGTPASVLARIFAYRDVVSQTEVERALPSGQVDALVESGFLRVSDSQYSCRARLMPFQELWLASDEMDAPGDPVMGPGATTLRLSQALDIPKGGTVLDVGCGAGSLALLAAARGAGEVVGVDLLERAVQWSRFNARLNDLEATFLVGDLTAPVAGRQFDLVVSQPPYVVQAGGLEETTTYLHGGQFGDEIAMRLIGELPGVMKAGGCSLLLFDSPSLRDAPVDQRLVTILSKTQLHTVAVIGPGHSADLQAIAYSSLQSRTFDDEYAAAVEVYRDHLYQLGIEKSSNVLLIARRPIEENEELLGAALKTDSFVPWNASFIEERFSGIRLAKASDSELEKSSVRLRSGAWLVQEQSINESKQRMKVRFEGGGVPEFELSEAAAVLVDSIQRDSSVHQVVLRFAQAADAQPAEVCTQVLEFVRQALVSGLLVPE